MEITKCWVWLMAFWGLSNPVLASPDTSQATKGDCSPTIIAQGDVDVKLKCEEKPSPSIEKYDHELNERFIKMRHKLSEHEKGFGNIYGAYDELTHNQEYGLTDEAFKGKKASILMFDLMNLIEDKKNKETISLALQAIKQLEQIDRKYNSMFKDATTDSKGSLHPDGLKPGELDKIEKQAAQELKNFLKANESKFKRWESN